MVSQVLSEVEVNIYSFAHKVGFLSPCLKLFPSAQLGLATKASPEQEEGRAGREREQGVEGQEAWAAAEEEGQRQKRSPVRPLSSGPQLPPVYNEDLRPGDL